MGSRRGRARRRGGRGLHRPVRRAGLDGATIVPAATTARALVGLQVGGQLLIRDGHDATIRRKQRSTHQCGGAAFRVGNDFHQPYRVLMKLAVL